MPVDHGKNVEPVFRWKLQKHVQSHMSRDKCEGSAINAQSCAKTMKPVNYAKCVHTVNGVTT